MTVPARPRRVRVLAILAWLAFLLALAEGSSRVFWRIRYHVGLFDTRVEPTVFFTKLTEVLPEKVSRTDSVIDVLLLDGSTLTNEYGSVGPAIEERLALATGARVRLFNLAAPAQTSRDSYFKYRALADKHFDLVIVYHGLNEVRANNIAPQY